MILAKYKKQPEDVKDYDIDYTPWLAPMSDIVAAASATAVCTTNEGDTSLTVDDVEHTEDMVKVWLSGGTSGEKYKVTVLATTAGGRVDESELLFSVRDI